MRIRTIAWLLAALAVMGSGVRAQAGPPDVLHSAPNNARTLKLIGHWALEPSGRERFDASGLFRASDGHFYTVNDKRAGLYRIEIPEEGSTARLILVPEIFSRGSLDAAAGSPAKSYDLEGLTQDALGNWYVCDELSRRIFRYDAKSHQTDDLRLDWSPVRKYFSQDHNASWEGIAIAGDTLYLANERSTSRIVVASLQQGRVLRSFAVSPPGHPARDVHYSDLHWYDGHLWVLCRESQCVLKVDPETETAEVAYDYSAIERDPRYGYMNPLPYGFVEGLVVARDGFWLVVDNNAVPRMADRQDLRPSLWHCAWPAEPPLKAAAKAR